MYGGNPQLLVSQKFNHQALEMYCAQRAAPLADPGAAAHGERLQLQSGAAATPGYVQGVPSERYLSARWEAEAYLQSLRGQPWKRSTGSGHCVCST